MPSKVIRLDEEAIAIALRHGRTVSEGIRSMDAKLTANEKTAAKPLDAKTLETLIRTCIREELELLTRGY